MFSAQQAVGQMGFRSNGQFFGLLGSPKVLRGARRKERERISYLSVFSATGLSQTSGRLAGWAVTLMWSDHPKHVNSLLLSYNSPSVDFSQKHASVHREQIERKKGLRGLEHTPGALLVGTHPWCSAGWGM